MYLTCPAFVALQEFCIKTSFVGMYSRRCDKTENSFPDMKKVN